MTSSIAMTAGVPFPAFYEQLGDQEFRTTPATSSPWDETLQHGGPPAALLARAAEHVRPDDSMQIARITVDMLGGIPQGHMRTEAEVVRPGRRIELIHVRLWAEDKLAVTASVWRIRVDPGSTSEHQTPVDVPAVPPEQPQRFFDGVSPDWGYGRAIDWRFLTGGFRESTGSADVWARLRIPLVEGEETSAVCRLLVVADSVNGLSTRLPMSEWLSIPPTLNVTVQRPPASEWMLLHAKTVIGPDGIGIARGQIEDEAGLIAEAAQPLLVQVR